MNPTEGVKFDQNKTRYDLLPPEFLEGTARILGFGANKYGERNWEKGMAWGRVFGALMRHMWAWWRGEKADPETGASHLHHAACCLAFLIAYEERKAGTDDRPAPAAQPQGDERAEGKPSRGFLWNEKADKALRNLRQKRHYQSEIDYLKDLGI